MINEAYRIKSRHFKQFHQLLQKKDNHLQIITDNKTLSYIIISQYESLFCSKCSYSFLQTHNRFILASITVDYRDRLNGKTRLLAGGHLDDGSSMKRWIVPLISTSTVLSPTYARNSSKFSNNLISSSPSCFMQATILCAPKREEHEPGCKVGAIKQGDSGSCMEYTPMSMQLQRLLSCIFSDSLHPTSSMK